MAKTILPLENLANNTLGLIEKLLDPSEERKQIKRVNAIKRNRKRIYKEFQKDGVITEHEKKLLEKLDNAWVEATIKLGIF